MIKEKLEDLYQEGQLIEVEITGVKDFGAFTVTTDGNKIRGLIHKSETVDDYVENAKDYFEEGDVLEARLINWDTEERQMSLSTVELDLEKKNFNNKKNSKLLKLKQKLKSKENKPEEKTIKKEINYDINENEFNKIVKYLNGKIGVLSNNAKEEIIKLIDQHGIFSFTRSLESVLNDFSVDFGVILSEKIEKDLKINKLVNYSISEHAVDNYIERSEKYFDNDIKDKNRENIKKSIQDMCYHGEVIVETEDIKYLKYGNWFLPCAKIENQNIESWKVKSMLTWEMFEENMQEKFDKYMDM